MSQARNEPKLDTNPPDGWSPTSPKNEKAATCKHVWAELSGPDDPLDLNARNRTTVLVRCMYCHTVVRTRRKIAPYAPLPANPRTGY